MMEPIVSRINVLSGRTLNNHLRRSIIYYTLHYGVRSAQ